MKIGLVTPYVYPLPGGVIEMANVAQQVGADPLPIMVLQTMRVGLNVAGPADPDLTQGGEVDLLAVDASNRPVPLDDQVHQVSFAKLDRMIFRRGRSIIIPSRADLTLDNEMLKEVARGNF